MRGLSEIGVILRTVFGAPLPDRSARRSRNLKEAISRLEDEAERTKQNADLQSNSVMLAEMLEQIK